MPAQVDIMIVSCSCFGPTPSLAAMVVNRFEMKESMLTYNLGGMGCSSSVIAVDLAKHLLMVSACTRLVVPKIRCRCHISGRISSTILKELNQCASLRDIKLNPPLIRSGDEGEASCDVLLVCAHA